jgi:hypothetical protein
MPGRVHLLGQLGRFVAAHARLAGPDRKGAAVQRQIAHLLAPTPHSLTRLGVEMEVNPVIAFAQQP